jgi:PAS domain-containing protein
VSHDPATRDAPPDASPVLRPGRVAAAELLDAVLDATPEVVAVKDRDGRYLAVNAAAARVMGRAPDAIVGRTDDELYPPDVAAALRAVDRRVVDEARRSSPPSTSRTPGPAGACARGPRSGRRSATPPAAWPA